MPLKVYYFGNQDYNFDNAAYSVVAEFRSKFEQIEFIEVKPNEDLPFVNGEDVVLLDTVADIKTPKLFIDIDFQKIQLPPRTSAHDFDLGFQLKYLKKLGKIGKVTIVGLPMHYEFESSSIQSIFKKLVAQDIQGS